MNWMTAEAPRATIASLEEVMTYENMDVVEKFMENWDLPLEEAVDLFGEMKKWLWLSADSIFRESLGEPRVGLGITHSMTLLDEMWHTFILFTRPYQEFCKHFFGFYINHAPTTVAEKKRMQAEIERDPAGVQARAEAEMTEQYSYIYDKLGAETLQKWYSDWTDVMSVEYLQRLSKRATPQADH